MAKRRSNNEGTIFYWEKKNLWVAKISLPNGKRKTKYGKTQKEVKDWLLTARNTLKEGVFIEDNNLTVSQFLERYLANYAAHNLQPSTFTSYSHNIKNHINPNIGNIKLTKLRADHLHALYNAKRDELSPRTVQYLHGIIHRSLNKAVKWGLLNQNPASKAETPRYQKKEMKTWTNGQIETAVVKRSFSRYAVRCLPLTTSRKLIRESASRAIRLIGEMQPASFEPPITLEVEFHEREFAKYTSWMPEVKWDGNCTVTYTTDDFLGVYHALNAMGWITASLLK